MLRPWLYLLFVLLIGALGFAIYHGQGGLAPEALPDADAERPPATESAESSCVACHQNLPQTFVGHTFDDWKDSPHAQRGISCHDCHGGDPTEPGAPQAHQGVRASNDPESRLYFTRIPATCGDCHRKELANFKESVHFARLQETGQGPNCITCHGSMAISIPEPEELSSTCRACHNERLGIQPDEPLKARFLFKLMAATREQLKLLRSFIREKGASETTAAAERLLNKAEGVMSTLQEKWHTFKLQQVEDQLDEARQLIRQVMSELGVSLGPDVP